MMSKSIPIIPFPYSRLERTAFIEHNPLRGREEAELRRGTICPPRHRRGTSRVVFEAKKRAAGWAWAAVPIVPERSKWAG